MLPEKYSTERSENEVEINVFYKPIGNQDVRQPYDTLKNNSEINDKFYNLNKLLSCRSRFLQSLECIK